MAQKKDNTILIILAIVGAILFLRYSNLFTIYLQSPQVEYNNKPIEARFTLANYTNPTITAFFNNVQVYTADYYTVSTVTEPVTITNQTVNELNETINNTYTINQTREVKTYPAQNQKYIYTYNLANGTYILKLTNVDETGIFKFVVAEGNLTETQVIEVRNPFVDIKNNMLNIVNQGDIVDIEITTYTPQGDLLEADSIDMTITDPKNKVNTISLTKNGNKFTAKYSYQQNGNYNFKIVPRKVGFDTKEFTVIVSSTKTSGIHPIIWVWMVGAVIFILFLIIKFARRKL